SGEALALREQRLAQGRVGPGAFHGGVIGRFEEGLKVPGGGDGPPPGGQRPGHADAGETPLPPRASRAPEGRGGPLHVTEFESEISELPPDAPVGGTKAGGLGEEALGCGGAALLEVDARAYEARERIVARRLQRGL